MNLLTHLRTLLAPDATVTGRPYLPMSQDTVRRIVERIEELENALRPFAAISFERTSLDDYDDQVIIRIEASAGELRGARDAVRSPPESEEGRTPCVCGGSYGPIVNGASQCWKCGADHPDITRQP